MYQLLVLDKIAQGMYLCISDPIEVSFASLSHLSLAVNLAFRVFRLRTFWYLRMLYAMYKSRMHSNALYSNRDRQRDNSSARTGFTQFLYISGLDSSTVSGDVTVSIHKDPCLITCGRTVLTVYELHAATLITLPSLEHDRSRHRWYGHQPDCLASSSQVRH